MKILKTLSLATALFLTGTVISSVASAANHPVLSVNMDTPTKTIVIKNMAAEDANKFFTTNTVFSFEVYKVGSKADVTAMIAEVQKNKEVESFNPGAITGDYQAFTLVLKQTQNKQFFVDLFKQAGLNHIKINRRDVTEVEKM